MPIGISDGRVFKDYFEYIEDEIQRTKPVINPFDNNNIAPEVLDEDFNPEIEPAVQLISDKPNQPYWDAYFGSVYKAEQKAVQNIINDKQKPLPFTETGVQGVVDTAKKIYGAVKSFAQYDSDTTQKIVDSFANTSLEGLDKLHGVLISGSNQPTGERHKTVPEKMIGDIAESFKKVIFDKVDPMSDEGIKAVFDIASTAVFGPGIPSALGAKLADGTLGSFMGANSKTFDSINYRKAQLLSILGHSADEIWEKTGMFKGADDIWRQEIDDSTMVLNKKYFSSTLDKDGNPEGLFFNQTKPVPLEDVLAHPALFEAYPELRNIKVQALTSEERAQYGAMYKPRTKTIGLGDGDLDQQRKAIMHEIQHVIQDIEGFAIGGSASMFRPKELEAARLSFEFTREQTYNEIKNKLSEIFNDTLTRDDVLIVKDMVKRDIKNEEQTSKASDVVIDLIKKEGFYDRLKNVVEAEDLLRFADDEAFEKYLRLMGEVESNLVERRLSMTKEERKIIEPYRMESYPREDQIYIGPINNYRHPDKK